MASMIESQKSILNTTRDATSWNIAENRFRRNAVPEFPRQSSSMWSEGTVNKSSLKPNEVSEPPKWPYRDYEGTTDPTTMYVSAGGDVVRKTGVHRIPPMDDEHLPVAREVLREQFSKYRNAYSAPKGVERAIDCVTSWSSRKKDPGYLRAEIAGFVTDEDEKRRLPSGDQLSDPDFKNLRKSLLHRYTWTSAQRKTQEQVKWDQMIAEKSCAFPIAYERNADPVSLTFKSTPYPPPSTDYQKLGNTWDKAQLRRGYYGDRPHTFVSVMPRAGQLVGYCGEVGTAADPTDKDNPFNTLAKDLLTRRRGEIPGLSYSSASPHIPGYTGKYQIKPTTPLRHLTAQEELISTTADIHRHIPLEAERTDFGKRAPLGSMVTTVPPHNPFRMLPEGGQEPMSSNDVDRLSADVNTDKRKYGLEGTLQM